MVTNEELEDLIELMDQIAGDTSVPRNVRESINQAKTELRNESQELDVRLGSAIYYVEDVSNDINLPPHARSELWNLVSRIEELKGQI